MRLEVPTLVSILPTLFSTRGKKGNTSLAYYANAGANPNATYGEGIALAALFAQNCYNKLYEICCHFDNALLLSFLYRYQYIPVYKLKAIRHKLQAYSSLLYHAMAHVAQISTAFFFLQIFSLVSFCFSLAES